MIGRMRPPINPQQSYNLVRPGVLSWTAVGAAFRSGVKTALVLGVLVATFAYLYGCNRFFQAIRGSGTVVAQTRTIDGDFDVVELKGSPSVFVTIDPSAATAKVTVTTDDNLHEHVGTTVSGGSLVIDTSGNLAPSKGINVEIVVSSLSAVRLYGSGDVNVTGIDGKEFNARIYGSGDVNLRGVTGSAELTVTGSGDIRAEKLDAQNVTAKVTGSGDITLRAAASVDSSVTGSGDITIHGAPMSISRSVTGSGDIRTKTDSPSAAPSTTPAP